MINLDNTAVPGVVAILRHGHHPTIGGEHRVAFVGSNVNAGVTTREIVAREIIVARPTPKATAGCPRGTAAWATPATACGLKLLSTRFARAARYHNQIIGFEG